MAKRSNPYIEDYIQQSKTHVGLKQFNNKEDRIKKVYEKTLALLYKGAKKTSCPDILQCCDGSTINKKDGKKQLFIGLDGSLLHSGTLVADKNFDMQNCNCGGFKADICAYCEKSVCTTCQHKCVMCLNIFCSKCSFLGTEEAEFCVSCYN